MSVNFDSLLSRPSPVEQHGVGLVQNAGAGGRLSSLRLALVNPLPLLLATFNIPRPLPYSKIFASTAPPECSPGPQRVSKTRLLELLHVLQERDVGRPNKA